MLTERDRRGLCRAVLLVPCLVAGVPLAGCTDGTQGRVASTEPAFGAAVRQTFAAQVIDPAPRYDSPVPATAGQQVAGAIDRYNADQVKKPERITTSRTQTAGN